MSKRNGFFSRFSAQFWLVVLFEFVERGAYYGVMSFLSVYFSDTLGFAKEGVGVIKGVIQPLLYFLPILAGAVADRFGYRKVLMVAFSLLGLGYFLTSQMTQYSAVFITLVVMGIGAGIFKPIISGTIAKLTTEENSTMGFGIYYWSINLGAFLIPLILVPWLKRINPAYVLISAGISTAIMIIPTWLLFKEPVTNRTATRFNLGSLVTTLAGAFEIIYSPVYLLAALMRRKPLVKVILWVLLPLLLGFNIWQVANPVPVLTELKQIQPFKELPLVVTLHRNMAAPHPYSLTEDGLITLLTINKPDQLESHRIQLTEELKRGFGSLPDDGNWISDTLKRLESPDLRPSFNTRLNPGLRQPFRLSMVPLATLEVQDAAVLDRQAQEITRLLMANIEKAFVSPSEISAIAPRLKERPFVLFFICSLFWLALFILTTSQRRIIYPLLSLLLLIIWFYPGLNLLSRIVSTVLSLTLLSLQKIPHEPRSRFSDHWRFLLMILLYSGFWVLYFQMFDSVLWYVRAYVDASSLNQLVNGILSALGITARWFFDVEHVTVISAGSIILLQLFVSKLVKERPALPTMITGIAIASIGMAILSISPHIGVFIAGLILFAIGEMTAHPKFISYVGIIAPPESKGLYMGYNFLYGVFGSAIGGVLGAKMYVHFVERLNAPATLWLLFSGIGLLTIVSLLIYNRFCGRN